MDPMDDIQPPTRKCISPTSVHFQDSLSNKSDRLLKSKVQGNRLTGHSHQFYTDFCCDEKRNDRDLHRKWNDREQLSNTELNLPVWPSRSYQQHTKKSTFFQDHQNSNRLMPQKSIFLQDH